MPPADARLNQYFAQQSLPVGFGPATTDEMCYDFLIAYPYDRAVTRCGPTL